MRRAFFLFVTAFWLVGGVTAEVSACINDVELPQHEREFRSRYNAPERQYQPPLPAPAPIDVASLSFAGQALLAMAAVAALLPASRHAETA